jgi:hypothetical protein
MKNDYKIKYNVEFGNFTRDDLEKDGAGGCDTIGVLSVIGRFGDGNPLSLVPMGAHSEGDYWSTNDWYEALGLLAHHIKIKNDLPHEKQELVFNFFENFRKIKLGIR